MGTPTSKTLTNAEIQTGAPLAHPSWTIAKYFVIVANGLVFLLGLAALAQNSPAPQPAVTAAPSGQQIADSAKELAVVSAQAEKLKIQFDYWDKHASEIQYLVGLILGINAIYAIALAVGAQSNLKSMLESARRELDGLKESVKNTPDKIDELLTEARTDLTDFRMEIRSDLPTLQNMDKALRNILSDIRRHLPVDQDWAESKYYSDLPLPEREQIRYAELTVAGFRFFQLGAVPSFQSVVSAIYRGLGHFYGSYYAYSITTTRDESLLARALLYFDEACAADAGSAVAFKDVGVLYTRLSTDPRRLILARQAFERSLQLNAIEPGALFGISWLEYEDGQWAAAISHLDTLIQNEGKLSPADRKKYLPDAYLNRACTRARSTTGKPLDANALLEDCDRGLKAAKEMNVDGFPSRLKKELATGDLEAFRLQHPDKVKQLLSQ
jgi:tetratricopeptide (TPR) repeat protein